MDDRITIYGSFTSSSSHKPMLFLTLARLPFSFRTVNLKTGAQHLPEHQAINRYAQVPVLCHRGLLEGREWLVGEACSIADIGCWGRMVFMAEGGLNIARWPNLEAWAKRLKALPGFALPNELIPKNDAEIEPA
jgi:glutathione S-transferase